VERNGQVGLEQRKIPVRGKYGDLVSRRYGADEEAGI
jgi:hypothetical protein